MFSTLIKRRLTDNQVANIFINAIFDSVDKGFEEVAQLINEDTAFSSSPKININNNREFGLIVIVGNLSYLESNFEAEQTERVEKIIFEKLSKLYAIDVSSFKKLIKEYQSFISRVNHPSKNWVYGMSKAIFYKYKLNEFQDEYYKRVQAPNPLFLKRMNEIMVNFIWNWDAFSKKFKL